MRNVSCWRAEPRKNRTRFHSVTSLIGSPATAIRVSKLARLDCTDPVRPAGIKTELLDSVTLQGK